MSDHVGLNLGSASGVPFILLGCFVQSQCDGFVLHIFVIFVYYLLEFCSFLNEKQKGIRVERKWGGPGRTRRRGNCNEDTLYEKRFYFQQKENNLKKEKK